MRRYITFCLLATALFFVWCPGEAQAQAKAGPDKLVAKKKAKALDPVELDRLYNKRMVAELGCPFYQFAKIFIVSSPLKLKYSVLLSSDSPRIKAAPLMNFYPSFYRPTFREILDQIALQSGSTWKYQPNKEKFKNQLKLLQPSHEVLAFEFHETKPTQSFKLKLAPGWREKQKPNSVMCIPPGCPMGLDIYEVGSFSADNVLNQNTLMEKVKKEVSLKFARSAKKSASLADFKKAKVGDHEALYFEAEVPTKTGYKARWRQWTFTVDSRCFIALSTIFPNYEEKLWPQVEKMLASFELTENKKVGS